MSAGFVYFLRPVGLPGPIKIGFSRLPRRRLAAIALWSPLPLEIIEQIPGTSALERNIHDCLWDSRSHLEWFFPTAKVVGLIDSLQRGVPIEQALDLSKRRRPKSPQKPGSWTQERRLRAGYAARCRHLKFKSRVKLPADIEAIFLQCVFGHAVPTAAEAARLEEFRRDFLAGPAVAEPTPAAVAEVA